MIHGWNMPAARTALILALVLGLHAITAHAQSTWTRIPTSANDNLAAIDFPTATVGYAVGDAGTATKTTDGGATWTLTRTAATLVGAIAALDESHAVAVSTGDVAYRTSDGGAMWTEAGMNATADLLDISFRDISTGIAVGDPGTVLTTHDGGATWTSESIPEGGFLAGVRFTPDGSRAFIAAAGGYVYRGEFAAGVPRMQSSGNARVTVAPNPFQTSATLRIDGATGREYVVTLCDIAGCEVLRTTAAANTSIALDRGSLPAGRYMYTAQSGTEQYRGMVVVR